MKKKITLVATSVLLVAALVIGGTLAYFTDTETKTNTFTVGNVDITLTEPNWKNDNAKLIPGRVIAKDPTITLKSGSERAYTFMKVELSDDFAKLLSDYAAAKSMDLTNETNQKALIAAWFQSTVSPKIMSLDLATKSVILGVLSPKNPGDSVTYFDAVTVPNDVNAEMIKETGDYKIVITAYAIQAEGFENEHDGDKHADRQAAYEALFPTSTTSAE